MLYVSNDIYKTARLIQKLFYSQFECTELAKSISINNHQVKLLILKQGFHSHIAFYCPLYNDKTSPGLKRL